MFFFFIAQKKSKYKKSTKTLNNAKKKKKKCLLRNVSCINLYASFINLKFRKRKTQEKVKISKHFYALTLNKIKIKKVINLK